MTSSGLEYSKLKPTKVVVPSDQHKTIISVRAFRVQKYRVEKVESGRCKLYEIGDKGTGCFFF